MSALIVPCPTCKKPTPWKDNPSRPFCSERCKLIDLGAWADEGYKIPTQEGPPSVENGSRDNHSDDE